MSKHVQYMVLYVYLHSGDIFTREGIGGVADEQTGLAHSPVEGQQRIQKLKHLQFRPMLIHTKTQTVLKCLYCMCLCITVHMSKKEGC